MAEGLTAGQGRSRRDTRVTPVDPQLIRTYSALLRAPICTGISTALYTDQDHCAKMAWRTDSRVGGSGRMGDWPDGQTGRCADWRMAESGTADWIEDERTCARANMRADGWAGGWWSGDRWPGEWTIGGMNAGQDQAGGRRAVGQSRRFCGRACPSRFTSAATRVVVPCGHEFG